MPVYGSNNLALDEENLPSSQRFIWVQAQSTRSPGSRVLCQMNYAELMGIWDYEEKLKLKPWTSTISREVLVNTYNLYQPNSCDI